MIRTLAGTIVTGDGRTVLEGGHVVLEDGTVAAVGEGPGPADGRSDWGRAVIAPGLVNVHAHGLTLGPIHATGSPALSRDQVREFKDRHLRGGTTTVLSVDGFPTADERRALAGDHPLKVRTSTAHTPSNRRAAELADGSGLGDAHRRATAAELLAAGAVVIGEIGAGGTLGGGMQDYLYIPDALEQATGVRVGRAHARAIKEAVLGRSIDPSNLDRDALARALDAAGLGGLDAERAVTIVTECVMPSMAHAFEGMREAASLADEHGVPFLVHHAAASAEVVVEVASERLVAAHVNHPSFTPDEAVGYARELRARGAILELSGLDLFSGPPDLPDAAPFRALVRTGLVDLIGTDYAGGAYDPVSVPLFALVREGLMTLPEAIHRASGAVAAALPTVTDAGLLEAGRPADVTVFDEGFTRVEAVYIDGALAHERGG
jgi:imidazolonepropionase-like amidohydrolase